MYWLSTLPLVASVALVSAAPAAVDERWFQPRDSAVSALFTKRQANPSDSGTSLSPYPVMVLIPRD